MSKTAGKLLRQATAGTPRIVSDGQQRPFVLLLSHPPLLTTCHALCGSSVRSFSCGRRLYVAAPRPGDGPLMERRGDRELPDVVKNRFRWSRTLPWFILIVAGCSVAIFNYQKSSSPVVASTLYALRTSPRARALLGDEIYFQQRIPWIAGEMNQMHGRIDISFMVKGTRGAARMRFTSQRPTSRGLFETLEWSLETEDGRKVDLLEDVDGGSGRTDPFRGIQVLPDEVEEQLALDREMAAEHEKRVAVAGAVEADLRSKEALVREMLAQEAKEAASGKETRGFRQATRT